MSSAADSGTAPIRAFLFDLDGVLWDSNPLHAEAVAQTCAEAGLPMVDYGRLAGRSSPAAFELIISEADQSGRWNAEELAATKRAIFRARVGEVPSDHEQLMDALRTGRPEFLALVTGASATTARAYLQRLPAGFFDLVITADDGLPSKPSPDAYLAAARRLGVEPGECVVFEDSVAGLAAARSAGARVAHITHAWGGRCDGSCAADWCAPTVERALELVRGER